MLAYFATPLMLPNEPARDIRLKAMCDGLVANGDIY